MKTDLRRMLIGRACMVGTAAILLLHPMAALAQDNAKDLPRLELTDAQKQAILISVTNQNFKNEAPPNFQPVVGAVVPENVVLEDMPKTIIELAPKVEAFRLARVINQVVIVDPRTRRVVDVIAKRP
ncbi:DUF1236 domain-containing protein [Pseudorhodoplanes sinuspersici]|nr:DUF1236 domain-containing protein [Pseudorhodoplanes sinuspersici]RKE68345.1 uncharacterized protein DUF1236 [Pseudorhodoplanes sinuspersici]